MAPAAELEMQGIQAAVGDEIRDIFDAQVVDIALPDPEPRLASMTAVEPTRLFAWTKRSAVIGSA